MGSRVVVIGGDAGGMSAAAELRRRLPDSDEVVVLERTDRTSYSACGIPYWVAGEVESADDLVARSPEEHRRRGIDLRTATEATAIDVDAGEVTFVNDDVQETIGYDRLVIATGAEPVRPDLPGIHGEGIFGIQTLTDGQEVIDALAERPEHVVVVGSGYIGLEMAEAFTVAWHRLDRRGVAGHPAVDPRAGARREGRRRHARAWTSPFAPARPFGDSRWRAATSAGSRSMARPSPPTSSSSGWVWSRGPSSPRRPGCPPARRAASSSTRRSACRASTTSGPPATAWSTRDRITDQLIHVPLGTHANKQGIVVADSIAADLLGEQPRLEFPGIVADGHHQVLQPGGLPHRAWASSRRETPGSTRWSRPSTPRPLPATSRTPAR